jgi:hypothetical protein
MDLPRERVPSPTLSAPTWTLTPSDDRADAHENAKTRAPGKSRRAPGVRTTVEWDDPPPTLDEHVDDAAVIEIPYEQTYNFDSSHVHLDLSPPAVRAAVRRLLEFALLYDRTEGITDPEDVRFEDLNGEPDLKSALDMVINIMTDVDLRRRRAAKTVRIAVWLPRLCFYLRHPAKAIQRLRYGGTGHPEDVSLKLHLRRQLGHWLFFRGVKCPREVLDEMIDTFANLSGKPGPNKSPGDASGFRERVGSFLREKKVIANSPSALDDALYAFNGRPRLTGSIKRHLQARALWAYRPPSTTKLAMYAEAALYPMDPEVDELHSEVRESLKSVRLIRRKP